MGTVLLIVVLGGLALVAYRMHQVQLRALALDRFQVIEVEELLATAPRQQTPRQRPVIRRYMWLPWFLGGVVGLIAWFFIGFSVIISSTLGLIVALLLVIVEVWNAQRQAARLEEQLAEAIDLMIGTLGAGAGLSTALSVVIEELRDPLRGQFQEILGRINYGDDARQVFAQLAARIPLDTYLLFASALSVHWEVGGNLTPTLSAVGRTIRDRLEIARRIRSNSNQSDISTVAIIGLTYFIALVMWRNSPAQMTAFVTSPTGEFFVAGSMLLQAVGIVWMNWMSRPNF
ncbi:type II secretion system F family protein [Blastopirellula marina]|uniref:Pilus assembly protein TadB n=1 Tax=Blastopirellula marina TaxID=124 RepID=A0A2S8G0S0_9BACT|nr:type II secretion system F family protein [Blastopirellula marina]PQO38045.1 pilus assembly protein TadB [Blastopirellula marina]PTL44701.1 pilus assembly protein TadB [Blastopirellula marina]